jgi:hypothetical protein
MADANGATSGFTYFMKFASFLLDPPLAEPADFHRPAGQGGLCVPRKYRRTIAFQAPITHRLRTRWTFPL